jgi:hypothetical protein
MLGDSITSSNQSSILAICKIVTVRLPFNLVPEYHLTAPSVHNHANEFSLGGVFLVDGQMYVPMMSDDKELC